MTLPIRVTLEFTRAVAGLQVIMLFVSRTILLVEVVAVRDHACRTTDGASVQDVRPRVVGIIRIGGIAGSSRC